MKNLHSFFKLCQMEPNKITCYKKSAKYKTCVIKEQLLKSMSYNKINQSHGLSNDETLFLSYQKVPKVNIACSYSE